MIGPRCVDVSTQSLPVNLLLAGVIHIINYAIGAMSVSTRAAQVKKVAGCDVTAWPRLPVTSRDPRHAPPPSLQ